MQDFFRVINAALIIYMVLIVLRIMSSWLRGANLGPWVNTLTRYLHQATDPYLQLFARFGFLRSSGLDFTPMAGIFVLVIAAEMTRRLATQQQVTPEYFLGVTVYAAWRMVSIVLLVLLVACVARFVSLRFLGRVDSPVSRITEALSAAPVRGVARFINLREHGSELNYLLVAIVVLFGLWIAGRVLAGFLVGYFLSMGQGSMSQGPGAG
jgi:uncharacterized protein YggT (Ycf19 family)